MRQGTGIPTQKHMRTKAGCSLGPRVLPYILHSYLLLEPEWPISITETLRISCSYNTGTPENAYLGLWFTMIVYFF